MLARVIRVGVALAVLGCCACQTAVIDGVDEAEANEIVLALDERGVAAEKTRSDGAQGFRVLVANDDVATALRTLQESELPNSDTASLATTFEEPGLVPTATEERARFSAAIAGDVARSIEAIDGVVHARVHVALPDPRNVVLDEPAPRPRASVLIKYRGANAPYDLNAVRALVAGAVDGLRPEDITIVGTRASTANARSPAFVNVGPIAVSRGSAFAFKLLFGLAIGINIVLAAVLIVVLLRRRNLATSLSA